MLTEIEIQYDCSVVGKINDSTQDIKLFRKIKFEIEVDAFGISNQIIDTFMYNMMPKVLMERGINAKKN